MLGQARRLAGNIEGAREALEKAVELAPDNTWYRDALERLGRQ